MKKLADEITGDCENNYEKCRAIEAYLHQYRYRTDTGTENTNESENSEALSRMADKFLFETGEGYCVHYTCAMIMLLREVGIPARYETGYIYTFPYEIQQEYDVRSKCAHAWPEAYIEGTGWIGFEPTAGYSTASDRTWQERKTSISNENVPAHFPVTLNADLENKEERDGQDSFSIFVPSYNRFNCSCIFGIQRNKVSES